MLRATPRGSNDLLSMSSLPLVKGSTDEKAAYAAYKSHNALFDHRITHHRDATFLCDITNLDHGTVREYTFGETDRYVSAFAKILTTRLPPRRKGEQAKVIGVMGRSGIDYLLNDFAIMRLGQVPLHISPSTSAQSISSLLRLTGGSHFIFGPEHQELAKASSSPNVDLFEWCSITKAQPVDDDPRWRTELSYEEEANETVSIIHSSGSTGDPKPIPWNHRTWLASTWFAPPGDNFIMTPLCHGYARMGAWSALANATRLFIFPTTSAPIGENLCKALRHRTIQNLWAVPALLKAISDSAGGVDLLQQIERVITCGSPLPTDLGNALARQGVPLISLVAASEAGSILDSTEVDGVWDHVRPRSSFERYYTFESQDDGTYELTIGKGYPSLSMYNRDNGSWETSDLYTPHPSLPNAWKYYGRKDDIILHVTGMKTNPVPMGTDRYQAALLVIPNGKLDIAPLLETVNANAPKHSKIVPELVKILPRNATFVVSDKGSLKRARSVSQYQAEIDKLYRSYDIKKGRVAAKL